MEIWNNIPETNGIYQASSLGQIRSVDRTVKHNYGGNKLTKGRILKQSKQRNGYLAVPIFYNGVEKRCNVHRLVASAFYGQSDLTVNHINGIKTDNRADNLEYCTMSQNLKHSFRTGLKCIDGEKHPSSMFTNKQAKSIYIRSNAGEPTSKLALEHKVAPSTISNIKAGRAYAKATGHAQY